MSPTYKHNCTADDYPVPTTNHPADDQSWTEVKKNKYRKPISLCGIAGPDITTLRAVEPRKYLHLWNMESSADEIRDYLRQLCPTGTCTVDELRARGSYKSFRIGVPVIYYEQCLSVDVWPVNARLNTWITYDSPRHPRKYKTSPNGQPSHQTFRT